MAMFQRAAQPAVDRPRRPPRADGLPVAVEPDFAGGVTGQILSLGVGQQRTQMQGGGEVFDVQMHDHGGVLPMGAAGGVGVPPGLDQPHERLGCVG
jgi:hypothetical protein